MNPLAALGRKRSVAMAAMLPVAMFVPLLGDMMRPLIEESVLMLLVIAFVRVDISQLRKHLKRPGLILGSALWVIFVVPLIVGIGLRFSGVATDASELSLGLMLQVLASPMMATPAIAAILGLDATLVLASLVVSSALLPVSATILVALLGLPVPITPMELGLKLLLMLGGATLAGVIVRRLVGYQRVLENRDTFDGLNLLALFVFLLAAMGGVGSMLVQHTWLVLGVTLLAFIVFGLLLVSTGFVFRRFGKEQSLALAVMSAQRNMGLMIATTPIALPELTWLYFAMSQLPTYLAPQVLWFLRRPKSA